MIKASKFHGHGNDFFITPDGQIAAEDRPSLARDICRRHYGMGADGCIFVSPLGGDRFKYRLYNHDGSEAGMSGNGGRCAAAWAHRSGRVSGETVILASRVGDKVYELLGGRSPEWTFRSAMGAPDFRPEAIPFVDSGEEIVEHPLEVDGEVLLITALNVGNPQCQILVEEFPDDEDFQRLGALLESHVAFPEKTNVAFAKVLDRQTVEIRIWERGVGPTHSSGTGSSASAIAAIVNGRADSPVTVRTQTGSQLVEWDGPGSEFFLTGSATFVGDVSFEWPFR